MNRYGKDFLSLVKSTKESLIKFPKEENYEFCKNGETFSIPVIELSCNNFNKKLLENCKNISIEKAKKTMNQNQAGEIRPEIIKIINQFRGVLAETIVHLYLYYECNLPLESIKRYDLERETFDYNPEEYDIKIIPKPNMEKVLEVRSSNNPYTKLSSYLANRGIICAYTNQFKIEEKIKDISVAVIYDLIGHTGRLEDSDRKNFLKDFKDAKYKIYLITHCATKETCKRAYEETNLGQRKTKYIQVPFSTVSETNYHIRSIITDFQRG